MSEPAAIPVTKRPGFWIFLWAMCVSGYYAATRVAKHNASAMPPAQVASTRQPAAQAGTANQVAGAAATGGSIEGTIELAADVAALWQANDTIYLIARRGQAGPPVAAKKLKAEKFPLSFTLAASDVMFQGVPFEGELDVIVRVDKDGDAATKSPGDLMGRSSAPIVVGSKGVKIVIDQKM